MEVPKSDGVGIDPSNRGNGDPELIENVLSKQLLCHHDPLNLVGTLIYLGALPDWSSE
jgi:hypothetical protein